MGAWCVLDEFRAHGLRLVRADAGPGGYNFTDLSPSGNVVQLNTRLKFQFLEYGHGADCEFAMAKTVGSSRGVGSRISRGQSQRARPGNLQRTCPARRCGPPGRSSEVIRFATLCFDGTAKGPADLRLDPPRQQPRSVSGSRPQCLQPSPHPFWDIGHPRGDAHRSQPPTPFADASFASPKNVSQRSIATGGNWLPV